MVSKKERVYDWASFILATVFVILCTLILIASLFAHNLLINKVNNIYTSIKNSYDESQTLVSYTNETMSDYKKDIAKVISSIDFLAEAGANAQLKNDLLGVLDGLRDRVATGKDQTDNLFQVIENLNILVKYANDTVNSNIQTLSTDDVKVLNNGLDKAASSLVELKTIIQNVKSDEINTQIAEGLTGTVNDSLDTANEVIINLNVVVKDQFKQLTNLKNSILLGTRCSLAIVTIFFVWAIYVGFELARVKYIKLKSKKSFVNN